jgi:hypothetical protein
MMLSTEWILASIGTLSAVISTLALVIYRSLSSEITNLRIVVAKLQDDVDRLSKGCGIAACIWKNR